VRSHQYQLFDSVDTGYSSILCNTSGAGKTRFLFEGLHTHWGFYFPTAQDTNGVGAQDLELMIGKMSATEGWTDDIFKGPTASIQGANAKNEKIALNRLNKVLLARWMVFRTFIEVARDRNAGNLPDTIKRDWLLFQILPLVVIDGEHPFVAFINDCLVGASTGVLDQFLDKLGPKVVLGSAFDPKHDTFFYVLDEAQIAGERYMGAFADANSEIPRPVLRPIVHALTASSRLTIKIIVSGTGFSLDLFKTVLASGVGKDPDKWDVVRETGDFTNRDTQASYISRYLPPSFLLSQSGTALVTRMFEWLRGR
jgi:hypothetical protein